MNEYYVVIVRSDRAVRGWTEEPRVYGRFNNESEALSWASHNQIMARKHGEMYEFFVSRLETPTGFGLALGG